MGEGGGGDESGVVAIWMKIQGALHFLVKML